MHRVGVVGRYQETGRDAHKVVFFGPAHDPVDPAQCIAEEGARGTLFAAGADFFIVKNAVDGHRIPGPGREKSLQGGKRALQVVQAAAGDELTPQAQAFGGHTIVQEEIRIQNILRVHARLRRDHLQENVLLLSLFAEQGKHVHLGVIAVSVIDLTVHMDGQIGNDQQAAVNIHEPCLNTFGGSDHDPARDRKGPVQPGGAQHAAVFFNVKLYIPVIDRDLRVGLDLENGRIAVACHDLESRVISPGNTEGNERRIVPGHVVTFAGFQCPGPALKQTDHSGPVQLFAHISDREKSIGTVVQKSEQFLINSCKIHFSFTSFMLFRLYVIDIKTTYI